MHLWNIYTSGERAIKLRYRKCRPKSSVTHTHTHICIHINHIQLGHGIDDLCSEAAELS